MFNNGFFIGNFFGLLIGIIVGGMLTDLRSAGLVDISIIFGLLISFLLKHIGLRFASGLFLLGAITGLVTGSVLSALIALALGSINAGLLFGFIVGILIKTN